MDTTSQSILFAPTARPTDFEEQLDFVRDKLHHLSLNATPRTASKEENLENKSEPVQRSKKVTEIKWLYLTLLTTTRNARNTLKFWKYKYFTVFILYLCSGCWIKYMEGTDWVRFALEHA
ncbi:hypothetical protein NPIL_666491 [Nephila pilipes]|uniref:Uncharacterized protein n=1 Tax=Nephila pilipes TaxID=299642 RepID=A0A8X6UFX0_NEPPI|nr:hypothetical protein NPIL_666491 [Nephila pilipes]